MAKDVGPTNPGATPVVPDPAANREQFDYTVALAGGQNQFTEEAIENVQDIGPELFLIQADNADTLTLRPHDGTNIIDGSISVRAAKPFNQQRSRFDTLTIDGVSYSYVSN